MTVFIGHTTALWALVRCHKNLERGTWQRVGVAWDKKASCNKEDLGQARECLSRIMRVDAPLSCDVLVRSAGERRHSQRCKAHVWSRLPEADAFFALSSDVYLSTPEFCFVQLARDLSFLELLQVGFALCGSYFVAEDERGFVQLEPLTTIEKLEAFIGRCKGLGGVKKARRALRYLAEGARSPMETVVDLLLTLPRRLGGYGLARAELNYRVGLSGEHARLARARYCLLDLCWPKHKFALEYNGAAYHQNRVNDENRRMALVQLGWTVQFLGSEQVFDDLSRNNVVRIIAKAIGKNLRRPSPACESARIALLEFLKPKWDMTSQKWTKPPWALPLELGWLEPIG